MRVSGFGSSYSSRVTPGCFSFASLQVFAKKSQTKVGGNEKRKLALLQLTDHLSALGLYQGNPATPNLSQIEPIFPRRGERSNVRKHNENAAVPLNNNFTYY